MTRRHYGGTHQLATSRSSSGLGRRRRRQRSCRQQLTYVQFSAARSCRSSLRTTAIAGRVCATSATSRTPRAIARAVRHASCRTTKFIPTSGVRTCGSRAMRSVQGLARTGAASSARRRATLHAIAQPCRRRSGWLGKQTQCSYRHWRPVAEDSRTVRHNRLPVAAGGEPGIGIRTGLDLGNGPEMGIGTPHDGSQTPRGTRTTLAATAMTVATAAGTGTAITVGGREVATR
jgi:hypothetical protein